MSIQLQCTVLNSSPTLDFPSLLGGSSVKTVDPSSKTELVFRLTESLDGHTVCALIVYLTSDLDSFQKAVHGCLPTTQRILRPDSSFVMLIGLNDENSTKLTNSPEIEEFAACHGAFHMEIFTKSKRNVDLTLKLMRIRASYLLKKNPAIASLKWKPEIEVPAGCEVPNELQVTPQFSSRTFQDYISENNHEIVSVGDLSEASEENLSDTLGSPPTIPPLNFHTDTEKRGHLNEFLGSFRSTERTFQQPLLVLEVNLGEHTRKVEVFSGENAFDIAREVLGGDREGVEALGELIYDKVMDYCNKVQAAVSQRVLFKVRVSIGKKQGEVIVKEGDDLETVAEDFLHQQGISYSRKPQILELLQLASKRNLKH